MPRKDTTTVYEQDPVYQSNHQPMMGEQSSVSEGDEGLVGIAQELEARTPSERIELLRQWKLDYFGNENSPEAQAALREIGGVQDKRVNNRRVASSRT